MQAVDWMHCMCVHTCGRSDPAWYSRYDAVAAEPSKLVVLSLIPAISAREALAVAPAAAHVILFYALTNKSNSLHVQAI